LVYCEKGKCGTVKYFTVQNNLAKLVKKKTLKEIAYLFEVDRFKVWPFLRQEMIGSGDPLGGPHSNSTVSPCATLVFCGSRRNSSRSTEREVK
jgi:hypothetical protein